MTDSFRVIILTPLPQGNRLGWIDIDPYRTALSWTTEQGGYGALKVGYKLPGMPPITSMLHDPLEVPDLATAQVWTPSESGFLAFEGRVQDVDDLSGLHVQKFTANGFGTAQGAAGDDWFYVPPAATGSKGTIDDVDRTAVQLLYRQLPAVTDILRMGDRTQVTDPGGSYSPRSQAGRYLGQTLDQITKAGTGGGQEIAYSVYEDRRVQLQIIEPPHDENKRFNPDYKVSQDTRIVATRSGAKLVGAVAVEFTPPGQSKQTTPVASISGWSDQYGGLFRSMLIPTSAMSLQQAMAVRDRYLRRYSVPVITGMISIGPKDKPLEGRFGQPAPYYAPRYGEWLQISNKPFFITKTNIDASSRRVTINFVNVPSDNEESP